MTKKLTPNKAHQYVTRRDLEGIQLAALFAIGDKVIETRKASFFNETTITYADNSKVVVIEYTKHNVMSISLFRPDGKAVLTFVEK